RPGDDEPAQPVVRRAGPPGRDDGPTGTGPPGAAARRPARVRGDLSATTGLCREVADYDRRGTDDAARWPRSGGMVAGTRGPGTAAAVVRAPGAAPGRGAGRGEAARAAERAGPGDARLPGAPGAGHGRRGRRGRAGPGAAAGGGLAGPAAPGRVGR